MKKISALLLLFLMGTGIGFAQLNEFKYFVVPKQFKTFDKPNKYKTSTLVKYLLVNNGMEAVYDDSQPPELILNPCMGLYLDLIDYKRLLTTEVSLAFNDCEGNEVFRTEKRKSSIKNFTKAFDDAIRKTFVQVEIMGYAYAGPTASSDSIIEEVEETKTESISPVEEVKEMEAVPARMEQAKSPLKADFSKDVVHLTERSYTVMDENGSLKVTDTKGNLAFYMAATLLDEVYLIDDKKNSGIVFKKLGKWFMQRILEDGSSSIQSIDLSFQN